MVAIFRSCIVGAFACAALLTGCASTSGESDLSKVLRDQPGNLDKNFSSPSQFVRDAAPKDSPDVPFSTLKVAYTIDIDGADGSKGTYENVRIYDNLGGGFVRGSNLLSRPGALLAFNYSMSYRGMIEIKTQDVLIKGPKRGPITEVKSISPFDSIPTKVGDQFLAEFVLTTEHQPELTANKIKCTATKEVPGADLLASLAGNVLLMDCENIAVGISGKFGKFAVLPDYGIVLILENTSSGKTVHYKYLSITRGTPSDSPSPRVFDTVGAQSK